MSFAPGSTMLLKIATKSFTDFSAGAVVNTISSGYTLPAKCIVYGSLVIPTTTFSGGLIATYTVSIGVGSGPNIAKYGIAESVFTGVAIGAPQMISGIESMSVGTPITLTATSTVANLSAATQGSVDIYLLICQLP